MRQAWGLPVLVTSLLVSAVLAGCVSIPSEAAPVAAGGVAPTVAWERELATDATTPEGAPMRSKADRTADVAPPGAPQYAAFDAAMMAFMESHQIPAASVAVLKAGKLRYESGYGFLDEGKAKPTPPDALFRIASITKPMTAAVVAMLVDQGRMAWDDPVFCVPPNAPGECLLPIDPHPKRPVHDERLADVTLRDLVAHQTGWTRWPCTEPFWAGTPIEIAEEFGIPTPPPAWRLAQWFMGTPMEFNPGSDPGDGYDTYCNMGYIILGLIAEAATGTTLAALYQAYLFEPLEVAGDVEPGNTLPAHRNPREPFYACDGGKTRSVFNPEEEVCWADGGFALEEFLGAGGLIATPAAVGAIFEVFENNGKAREPGVVSLTGHSGGLPGTATTALRLTAGPEPGVGDVQMVVFFNKVTGHEMLPGLFSQPYEYQLLHATLLGAYAGVEASGPAAGV